MTQPDDPKPPNNLLFTKADWDAAMPELTRAMTSHLKQYRTPIFIDRGDDGEQWGSGSFIELHSRKYILTNEHNVRVRSQGKLLGFRFDGADEMPRVIGNHVEQAWPWDLALLPVSDEAWSSLQHTSKLIQTDQIALAHTPFPSEIFAFAGYAGDTVSFHFGEMQFGATTSLSQEAELTDHEEIDHRFHFGLRYLPDQATTVVGNRGLPRPYGFSGSTVWNTCFVETKVSGVEWRPSLAKVAGVVFGWPSGQGNIVATKAEHVRSFLLDATNQLEQQA